MLFFFIIVCLMAIYLSRKIHNTFINPFTVLCIPYIFVIVFNKIVGERIGFYSIGNMTLIVIGTGLLCFFCGSLMAALNVKRGLKDYIYPDNTYRLDNYKMKKMLFYCLAVTVIGLGKAFYIIGTMGVSGLTREGTLIAGPIGHLILTVYPLQPILLLYWLKNKKQASYLVVFLLFSSIIFCSFVKYHIIGLLVICYLFIVLTDRAYLKKGTIILVGIVSGLFVLNYVIGFIARDVYKNVQSSFYLNHLWKYIAGAIINGDRYYSGEVGGAASTGYKMLTFLFSFPNMFLYGLFHIKLFPYKGIDMIPVSFVEEYSNVIDAISYMYPLETGVAGKIAFGLVFIAFGFLIERLFLRNIMRKENLQIFITTIMAFFLFFSFFGTFYINSMPWEIALYSALMPQLFNRRARIKFL